MTLRETCLGILVAALLVPATDLLGGEPPMREVKTKDYLIELDLREQVLKLEIPEDRDYGRESGPVEAPLTPTLGGPRGEFLSASVLAQKAKQFDDGLYAAVELAAQQGMGSFSGKSELLSALAKALAIPQSGEPGQVLLASAQLGGLSPSMPASLREGVDQVIEGFLANPLRSKPIGFYTWSEELRGIFWQDRMLQSELKGAAGIEAVVRAIHADRKCRDAYDSYLALTSRLTNPPALPPLTELLTALDREELVAPSGEVHFFPPSRAYETDLVKMLYGSRRIPAGFDLADEMVKRIRAGKLKLKPTERSGWYDYQTWALEPLVIPERMPEAAHLRLGDRYRKQLEELFKGVLTLTRETHVKQLEIPAAGAAHRAPRVTVRPRLSAEPTVTYYRRRAHSYRFVRKILEDAFGVRALAEMHRLTARGPVEAALAEELCFMEELFHGAYVVVSRELGVTPESTENLPAGTDGAVDAFLEWEQHFESDPDVGQDTRAMVPVFYDVERRKTKVWLMLGWTSKPVRVSFEKRPTGKVVRRSDNAVLEVDEVLLFQGRTYYLWYPVMAEVYVTKVLDREEFRTLCNRQQTRSKILAALAGL
ncbi:hypothetical protein ACFL59_01595 [Planctomycetota bacterium]